MQGAGWSNASSPGFSGADACWSAGSSILRTSSASSSSLASSSSSGDFEIGSSHLYASSAAFEFEVPKRICPQYDRNFKFAALGLCRMSLEAVLFQALNGLAAASSLFLVGAGLSLIFGVTRIINIAHGSFYMLGLYLAYTFATGVGGALRFWGGILLAALLVGALGALIEVALLRRIYQSPELFQLLA